ncbi:hypothetical protein BGZ49_007648 [Haplosporangium sp. Z 27]|nr:hypothetical protein BGZ49_007648 [Haplosporangium sp. Z 27]
MEVHEIRIYLKLTTMEFYLRESNKLQTSAHQTTSLLKSIDGSLGTLPWCPNCQNFVAQVTIRQLFCPYCRKYYHRDIMAGENMSKMKRKPLKKTNRKKDDDEVSTVSAGSARDAEASTDDKESKKKKNYNAKNDNATNQPNVNVQGSSNVGSGSSTWEPKPKLTVS